MPTWKIRNLREKLADTLPRRDFEQARRLLASLDWKIRAEKYHVRIAEQAFQEHFGDWELSPDKAFGLALSDHEDGAKFAYSQSVREFNLVAAVAASHTTPELFSQLIAILFISEKIDVHAVTIRKVLSQLPDGKLKSKIQVITESPEYDYFRAFTNMSKHISQVIPEYHFSFEEAEYHGVRFKEFEYKGCTYRAKRDEELLKDLRIMRNRFLDLGVLINDLVH